MLNELGVTGGFSGHSKTTKTKLNMEMARAASRFTGHEYNGLENQGATCYLNAVLQCLYMTEDFRREVENFTRDPTTSDEESIELIEELQKLFKMLKQHCGTTEGITRCLRIFDVREQQDVMEYYQKILHMITPQMSKIFNGELKTSIRCLFEHKHEQMIPLFCIPLPIDSEYREVFSVDMAIEKFSKKVNLGEDNLIYCDHCGQKSEALTWTTIETFPNILTLNLKRFYINYYEMKLAKDHSPVKISLQLEFENHIKYQLYAVINHMGEGNGGHYNAVIKSFEDNEWYRFDDHSVTKEHGFEESLQCSNLAYLLMYRKMDDPHPDTSTNLTTNSAEQNGQSKEPLGYDTTDLDQRGQCELFSKSSIRNHNIDLSSALHHEFYYDIKLSKRHLCIKLWSHRRQDGNWFASMRQSLMKEDTPSAMCSYTLNTLEAAFQGLDINTSGLNVPVQCEKLDADKKRWNLQVTGIQERQGEDIRKILIDLFSKVSPDIAHQLSYNLAYRVGARSEGLNQAVALLYSFFRAVSEIKCGGMQKHDYCQKKGK